MKKFSKKELLLRGPVLLLGLLCVGYFTINLNVGLLLAMVLGGATWECILFVLFRYGIITWSRWGDSKGGDDARISSS